MMLSRSGRDRDPPCLSNARLMRAGRHHGVVWWVRPTGGRHLLLLLLLKVSQMSFTFMTKHVQSMPLVIQGNLFHC